jgi:hypothetical protein
MEQFLTAGSKNTDTTKLNNHLGWEFDFDLMQ